MSELSKAYDPKGVEDKWYAEWLDKKYFHANADSKKPAYSIVIPPPNVTGVLTIGHVLNNTLQDILIRRRRMQGFEALWLPGTDHAGIATQTVVERMLKKEGVLREALGREEFLKRVWEWKDKHGGIIIQQLKKLGCSCDWEREVFTMDGIRSSSDRINYSACVHKAFVDLYDKGLIYRGRKMVNWCSVSKTALSDEEVVMKEVDGRLWHFRYPVAGTADFIVVATTRPETMLGDEAVVVNPKDKRYKNLVGKKVVLPLVNKLIPVIADNAVEKGFGTGAVKVTPAHDPVDYDIGLRHKLPITVVIGPDGRMTEAAGDKYEDMDRFECREAVVADMEEAGLLEKTENYKHNVGFSQRADVPIEPYLSEQWFLKYPKVKEAIKAVASGKIKFWPVRWAKVYKHWMENIHDWCISRQLWWGHRIPSWECKSQIPNPKSECRKPIVSLEPPTKCPHCGGTEFEQDKDVLDTWFSSWLWPFATMGWPNKTSELKKFYPTSDLVTGPDIIFFWVARMIMAGCEFMGDRPFDNVYFTGIIRDSQGRKMSKSLGNSPDPLTLIDRFGADGLRFGLMLIAPKGQDILFSEDRIEVGRNFMNKLWNASRFVMMNTKLTNSSHYNAGGQTQIHELTNLSLADKWILNRLQHAIHDVNKALDHYQFDTAARALYQFVWGEYCDWYLELSKTKANEAVLLTVLDNILRLLHPFAPFITEEIRDKLRGARCEVRDTIMFAEYPSPAKKTEHTKEALQMQKIMDVIVAIRNLRGEHNVGPGKQIPIIIVARDKSKMLEENKKYITDLAKVSDISFSDAPPKNCATAAAGGVEIYVPFAGMIDVAEEKERLSKEIGRLEKYVVSTETRLSNKDFIERAPKEVVEKERGRAMAAKLELERLKKNKEALECA